MTQQDSRRQEILHVALSLAEESGIGSVTTMALARRMGFTEAALYRYFPAKTAILAGMLHELAEQLFQSMGSDLALRLGGGTPDVVAQLATHIQRFTARNGLLLELLLFTASSRVETLMEAGYALLREYSERMTVFFAQRQTAHLVTRHVDAEELSRLWVCQLLGGFVRGRLASEPWSPADLPGFRAFAAQLATER